MIKKYAKSEPNTVKAEQSQGKQVRYRIKDGYALREIAGEYLAIPVLLSDDAESKVAILSEGGQFLWEQLREEKTLGELVGAMTDEFEVSAEEAERDIEEFIVQLKINQLVICKTEEIL